MTQRFGWRQVLAWPLITLVRLYQVLVSPMLGPTCRYYPSCSSYAVEALRMHGPLRGTWLAGRRLLRCHPWSAGGVDHVPARERAPMTDRPTDGADSSAPPNPRTPWAS